MTILQRHDRGATLDLHNPDGTHIDLGSFRIEERPGRFSGATLYTLQFMAPADSWAYGVWEDVKTFYSRAEAEAFRDDPEPWFANGDERYRRLAQHLAEHAEHDAACAERGVCPFVNWGVTCIGAAGHDGDHDPGPDAFPSIP